jgi:ABC-type dipeptide/oligopeptide/nickel transport system ATPase component
MVIENLRVQFGGRRVIHGIDLDIAPGERVALVGVSGSGKSLTAAAAVGLLPGGAAVSGRVSVGGLDALHLNAAQRPAATRVGLVRQDSAVALNPLVRVGTQLALPQRCRLGRREARAAAVRLLTRAAFADPEAVLRRYPGELSGGQRQRICIALALAGCPGFLVADEPTTALDVVTQADVLRLLRDETGPGRSTLLFVTHDLAVAADLCERIVVLEEGRVVEDTSTAQVLDSPAHAATRAIVDAARRADLLAGGLIRAGRS